VARGRGRPRHPDVLTPAEWRVAEHVRDGRTNAEIAVRLGISVNTVRFHVSHILDKLALGGREELKSWTGEPRQRFAWMPAPLLLGVATVGALALVLGLLAAANRGTDQRAQSASLTPPSEARTNSEAAALPFAQHADYREYQPIDLSAAGFVDTGAFIEMPYNPLPAARSSYRAAFTAIEVVDAGYLNLQPDGWHRGFRPGEGWSSTQAIGLTAEVQGVALYATFSAGWGVNGASPTTQLLPTGQSQVGFYPLAEGGPVVLLAVQNRANDRVPAIVDVRGHLWIRPEPIDEGPTANDTGERLEFASATTFGPLPKGVGNWQNLTWCGGPAPCIAILHLHEGGGLAAVADGIATCEDGDQLTVKLTTDAFTLRFVGATPNAMSVPNCEDGFPRTVSAGEMLSKHPSWEVSAFAPDGRPIGVASDRTHMLYVGVERTIEVCPPCYTGS